MKLLLQLQVGLFGFRNRTVSFMKGYSSFPSVMHHFLT